MEDLGLYPGIDAPGATPSNRKSRFSQTERPDGYLMLHNRGVELHFSQESDPTPGQCFLHVADAVKLWKQLRDRGIAGVGEVAEQDYGLREFVLTDPDGNRVRFGSPTG